MTRQAFTMGTPDMVIKMTQALHSEREGVRPYRLTLQPDDMSALIFALATAVGYVDWGDAEEGVREQAESLFSGIAETLDIEGI